MAKNKINTLKIGFIVFLLLFIIPGALMLFFGIKDTFNFGAAGYKSTEGYLSDYTLYNEEHYDGAKKANVAATYILTYAYTADGKEYAVSTSSATSFVPKVGSKRKIMYLPQNPENAVIAGNESGVFLIIIGILFTAVPSMILYTLVSPDRKKSKKKKEKKLPFDTTYMILGCVFIVISAGGLYMITGTLTLAGLAEYFRSSFMLPLLIPIAMFFGGVLSIIKSFSFLRQKGSVKNK